MPRKKASFTTEVDARVLHRHLLWVANLVDAAHDLSKVVDDMATALGDEELLTDINRARTQLVFAAAIMRGCADRTGETQTGDS
jgi:hypothetical protein